MSEPNSEPVDLEGLFDIMTQSKSKSQMRRLAIQTGICETVDIVAMGRLVAGNLHATGDIGWVIDSETVDLLCSEVERLQVENTHLEREKAALIRIAADPTIRRQE